MGGYLLEISFTRAPVRSEFKKIPALDSDVGVHPRQTYGSRQRVGMLLTVSSSQSPAHDVPPTMIAVPRSAPWPRLQGCSATRHSCMVARSWRAFKFVTTSDSDGSRRGTGHQGKAVPAQYVMSLTSCPHSCDLVRAAAMSLTQRLRERHATARSARPSPGVLQRQHIRCLIVT